MKLILCGGGWAEKTIIPNRVFETLIDVSKPILYIPFARDACPDNYASCLTWVNNEFKDIRHGDFIMAHDADEIVSMNLSDFTAIFVGGGNTFSLLAQLKASGAFDKIRDFVINGGAVYGCSAGAIIFGADISVCEYMDANDVRLADMSGFDMVCGYSVTGHYTNKNSDKTAIATNALERASHAHPILALPEEDSLYINDNMVRVIGTRPYYIFSCGKFCSFEPGTEYTLDEFTNLYRGV